MNKLVAPMSCICQILIFLKFNLPQIFLSQVEYSFDQWCAMQKKNK